jgi:asparagine synthase (glutamine-hydrolysing)
MQTGAAKAGAVRAMFAKLVDYAGLFPPAQLAMPEAVAEYDAERNGTHAWMLGRFIVPVSRAQEMLAMLPDGEPFAVSVILDAGPQALAQAAKLQSNDALRVQALEIVLEPDAAATLPRLAAAFDEPLGDEAALPLFLVCEAARREVTVGLVGDGGDESFAGYERYTAMGLAARVPAPAAAAGARLLRALPSARGERRSPAFRAARFLDAATVPAVERYGRLMEVLTLEQRRELWSDDARAEIGTLLSPGFLLGGSVPQGISGLQRLDIDTYLPGDLLPKSDIASMAHSLELRSPLLDHRVVELGLALPDHLKRRGREGKIALRRAFAHDLPPSVSSRGKSGFGVPLAAWFRGELRPLARELLLGEPARSRGWFRTAAVERLLDDHAAGRADNGHRLWTLVMLELWQRAHVDEPVPTPA